MPTDTQVESSRAEWAAHWQVPLASALALAVSVVPIYSLGALMPAIHASTGWSRAQISTGPTLISIMTVLLSPLVGIAIDRFGSRKVGLPGLIFYCTAVASIALSGPKLMTWWVAWMLVAIAYACVKMTVWTAAVVSLFKRSRGMALGVTLAGLGLGSSCLPYLTTLCEEHFGWRGAYMVLAGGGFVLAFPLVWFCLRDAGDGAPGQRRPSDHARPEGVAPRVALLSRNYLQMAFACLFAAIPSTAFLVHFVPIVRAGGLSPHSAAAVAGAIGITSILGRISGGYLLDRLSPRLIGFVSCALPVVAGPLLLTHHGRVAAVCAASMIGLSAGSEISVLAFMIPLYFGLRHFGLLFGILNALITAGLGVGPLFAAEMFDHSGSYQSFLWATVPLFALSAVLLGTLGPPKERLDPLAGGRNAF